MLSLTTPITELYAYLPRMGTKTAHKLAVEICTAVGYTNVAQPTVEDLLYYLPFRYEDRSNLQRIRDVTDGLKASLEVVIQTAGNYPIRTKAGKTMSIFELGARDATGQIRAFWWNQPFLSNTFSQGQRVILFGEWKYSNRYSCFQVENPEFEILSESDDEDGEGDETSTIHTGRRVPVYRKLGTFRTRALRTLMHRLLGLLTDVGAEFLPAELLARQGLPTRLEAFRHIHFPPLSEPFDAYPRGRSPAHARLAMEEFFLLSIALFGRRAAREQEVKGTAIEVNDRIRRVVREVLPFKPTNAQKRVIREIVEDMTSPRAMHRLLQGDVGAGKTMVAMQATIVAIENGYQVALMAPTEILVEQHTLNLRRMLASTEYRIAALTGSLKPKEKQGLRDAIAAGEIDLVVGTQALVQETTVFSRLGLVVIDEQHRFGVIQRTILAERGIQPDVLVMTATPIPRSLAMTAYGDLDVSVLDELPPGRQPIRTVIRTEAERPKIYDFIRQEAKAGRQTYIVFPLVEESEKMDLKAATQAAENLQHFIFTDLRVGLLHGKLKPAEKEAAMANFAAGEYQILVSTTVIEVGVDVPKASVMLIEHPERFGLAQLHQLRGRIGRGADKSYCILMDSPKNSPEAKDRLKLFASTQDGFVIAEKDLEIRGPGEVFGTRQSGVPVFRVANLVRDRDWLEITREIAYKLMTERSRTRETARLIELAQARYPQADVQLH